MVTLITRPMPGPHFKGATGAERAKARQAWLREHNGETPATKETRQNRRWFMHKARKAILRGAMR